ncbi:CRISPR-associated helicase, Cas3 family [Caloramator quimbayensis]|uniref:CRISPR-associated helicase, Cas3 family n=1 Tax=Caloramator quimbayensis TaxID=1147123 RepID=A0A1T4WLM2_9CLOT|nr:CRISPR-associated helicase/endonuclease Cas3 [Caloramator quimbayensis]SKA78233.1 CRISPR-associated helicase, Cas3 family [Caloramator quimbayensis]
MIYYAHSKEEKGEECYQRLEEHLSNTADLASKFASSFNSQKLAYIIGKYHDIGKYSSEFQKKLRGENIKVDHSTAGAQLAYNLYGEIIGKIIAYCIAGHHAGLIDYGTSVKNNTLESRLKKSIYDYSSYKKEIEILKFDEKLSLKIDNINSFFSIAFFTKMLYSCLVDADFIDTEKFMSDGKVDRNIGDSLGILYTKLFAHLETLKNSKGYINIKRNEILKQCIEKADNNNGIYSLTVPTGGGKTKSSLAFALKHALKNNMNRIIYVIPYTSIIEQNAAVFKEILGKDNVLEHHSNFIFDEKDDCEDDINYKLKLSAENWDIPVVVTTNVQFYESLFSNKPSKCRKIHNISNSVIIIDEAQMIPHEYLKPCIVSLYELTKNYNCTVVLCTATQPTFNDVVKGIEIKEIIDSPQKLFNDFKRVNVIKKREVSDDSLSQELLNHKQVLCIVNTRKHAKKLYEKMKWDNTYHLSSLMCPIHRSNVLKEIKEKLLNGSECRVVSTQLIEAGVDIDFPTVYREISGIDSIAQSAGRCNREGKIEKGEVFVFSSTEDYSRISGWLNRTKVAGEMTLRKYEDILSIDAINFYFKQLYDMEKIKKFDYKDIMKCFEERVGELKFEFATASDNFKIIDDNTYSVVIPFDENALKIIESVKFSKHPKLLLRKLQQYTVSIYESEYKALLDIGAIEDVGGLFYLLKDKKRYDDKEGLIIAEGSEALCI